MPDYEDIKKAITDEVKSDKNDIRKKYIKAFKSEIDAFIEYMVKAYISWKEYDDSINGDEKKAYVSGIMHSVISLQVQSMELFISGHHIAAGNMQRQAIEAIALLILCSNNRLSVLHKIMENKYSTNKAVDNVLANASILNLNKGAVAILKKAHTFYHKFSHPTLMTIAIQMSFTDIGVCIGAHYDKVKLPQYKKEIDGRVGLAKIFIPVTQVVRKNVSTWA